MLPADAFAAVAAGVAEVRAIYVHNDPITLHISQGAALNDLRISAHSSREPQRKLKSRRLVASMAMQDRVVREGHRPVLADDGFENRWGKHFGRLSLFRAYQFIAAGIAQAA